jgi:hypothetical protein
MISIRALSIFNLACSAGVLTNSWIKALSISQTPEYPPPTSSQVCATWKYHHFDIGSSKRPNTHNTPLCSSWLTLWYSRYPRACRNKFPCSSILVVALLLILAGSMSLGIRFDTSRVLSDLSCSPRIKFSVSQLMFTRPSKCMKPLVYEIAQSKKSELGYLNVASSRWR